MDDNWKLWCRLCAKSETKTHINIFSKDQTFAHKDLLAAIEKHFLVKLKNNDVLPKMLCSECFLLMKSLLSFTERVSRVQQMFGVLQREKFKCKKRDLQSMRKEYGLLDSNRIHVPALTEVHYITNEYGEEESLDAETKANNPLELPHKKPHRIKIKNSIEKKPMIDENSDSNADGAASAEDDDFDNGDEEEEEYVAIKNKSKTMSASEDDELDEKEISEKASKSSCHKRSSTESAATPYSCAECQRKFKRIRGYRLHMQSRHNKETPLTEFACPQCPRTFKVQYKLKLHSKKHLPLEQRKIIPCPYCDKKFTSDMLMQVHIKHIHMDERPFICEECGLTLRSKSQLQTHMLVHSGDTPFKCDICEKGFKEKGVLKRHMEIHDPTKPICPKCGLQLSSRTTLNQHLLVHSDEMKHKCDECGRAFKRAKTLKNHLILHAGLKPYACDFCELTFAIGSSCRVHKKKVHPKELAEQEAAGEKSYTRNIPKLKALKVIAAKASKVATPVGVTQQNTDCTFNGK